jgi:hypothetical protein
MRTTDELHHRQDGRLLGLRDIVCGEPAAFRQHRDAPHDPGMVAQQQHARGWMLGSVLLHQEEEYLITQLVNEAGGRRCGRRPRRWLARPGWKCWPPSVISGHKSSLAVY